MAYDIAKRTGGVGGSGTRGQQPLAIGKRTLVDQLYHEQPQHGAAPLEAPPSGPLTAIRFSDDADLIDVAAGKKTLAAAATGIAVTKVQRALVELGYAVTVTHTVDAATVTALKTFQHAKAIGETGSIDKPTMLALDAAFTDYSAEGALLKGMKTSTRPTEGKPYDVGKAPKELLAGTHIPDATERAALGDALSTEVKADPKTGAPPNFVEVIGGQKYGDRIEAVVNKVIDAQLAWAKPMEKDRSAGHLYDWGDIEKVGVQSKAATDASFGHYATGKPLKATGVDAKIKDAWEFKAKQLAADPGAAAGAATWRVTKILDGDASISAIDKEHGAIQTRAAEKAIIDPIRAKIAAARQADLVLIHKAWPAFASGNDVFIQRIEKRDATGSLDKAEGRNYMWDTFQTIIHEYIHTLEHPAHQTYRATLPAQQGGFTLREGTTDYFTKIAYNNTDRTSATLRMNVEGPFHEPGVVHPVPALTTYRESANAERAAGIVGLPNLCGAFFLGHVELIGKV